MNIVRFRKSGVASEGTRRTGRWLGRTGLATALVLPGALVVGSGVGAAEPLAEAVVNCNEAGDQFVLASYGDLVTTAEAVDASGAVVTKLDVVWNDAGEVVSDRRYRLVTVPPGTEYSGVRFSNADKGLTETVAPVVESCTPTPINAGISSPGQGLIPVSPQRLLDTRVAKGANQTPAPVAGGATVEVAVLGEGAIPRNAGAVMLNVGAVQPQSVGHLRVYPCGTALPKTSSLNYVAGETRAADVFVKPGAGGKVCIYTSSQTHVIADVQGYVPAGSQPYAIPPVRIADTRVGAPVDGPGLLPRKKVDDVVGFPMDEVAAAAGLPADAHSLVINVTATNATGAGFVTVNDCYGREPTIRPKPTSTLNFAPGRAVANLAFTETDLRRINPDPNYPSGWCIYASRPVDLIVDVTGYSTSPYVAPAAIGQSFRALDTRPNNGTTDGAFANFGRLKAGTEYKIRIGGRTPFASTSDSQWPIPPLTSLVLNTTAIRPDANGHVTVYRCGKRPGTSNLNVRQGQTVANAAYVQLDSNGDICVYSSVATDLVLDINAYGARSGSVSLLWDERNLDREIYAWGLPIVGGTPPFRVSGNLPASVSIEIDETGIVSYAGADDEYTIYKGTISVIDAKGKTVPLVVDIAWLPNGSMLPMLIPRT